MTHYVITSGNYSDYHIVAVFSDEKEAEKMLGLLNAHQGYYDYKIEYWEDGFVAEYREGCYPFFVCFQNNSIKWDKRNENFESCMKDEWYYNEERNYFSVYVFAKDEQEALKIASERRAKIIGEQTGVV